MAEAKHDEKRRWLRLSVRVSLGMTCADSTVSIKKDDIRALDGDVDCEEETYRELIDAAVNTATRALFEKISKMDEDDLEFDPKHIRERLTRGNGIGFQGGNGE